MNEQEIAMQITLKAMETGFIKPGKFDVNKDNSYETFNDFSTAQICKFYETVLETVNPAYKKD